MSHPATSYRPTRAYAWGLVVLSALALLFSALLMYERVLTLEDPTHIPACTVNAYISCTDVMNTPQAAVLGNIPNALFGVIGYSAILALAVTMLSGFTPPRWMWLVMLAGFIVCAIFVHWLFYQSVFVIVALCPYCAIVWGATMAMLISTIVTVYRRRREAAGQDVSRDVLLPTVIWLVWAAAIAFLVVDRLVL
ncbi:vitamin K epoxide reductase family protein [Corynebacterium uropygiale]|uniref:Vitamin K epoxide reductase family protein n=1 Tax=Corynebacterium uropygiale TaxID=1775911 RepID=A0A9X1QUU1_9CORY|nr:vitamin K epoxide reductase family protein [Corynebacterium uropygiale]MCF4007410.1 vitamin K epoxide reductase family protein [Corynebacterium uropygiale]